MQNVLLSLNNNIPAFFVTIFLFIKMRFIIFNSRAGNFNVSVKPNRAWTGMRQ